MHALTIRQPYAGAIFQLGKSVENRTDRRGMETARRVFTHRGTLAIHTSARLDGPAAFREVEQLAGRPVPTLGLPGQSPAWAVGQIIGVVNVVGVHTAAACYDQARDRLCSPWAHPDAAHIQLHPQTRLLRTPIDAKGRLGLWAITDPSVRAEIRRQLA